MSRDLPFAIVAIALLVGGWIAFASSEAPTNAANRLNAPKTSVVPEAEEELAADAPVLPHQATPEFAGLRYPDAKRLIGDDRVRYSTPDALHKVAQWYWHRVPTSSMAEVDPSTHLIVANEQLRVDIERVNEQTIILLTAKAESF